MILSKEVIKIYFWTLFFNFLKILLHFQHQWSLLYVCLQAKMVVISLKELVNESFIHLVLLWTLFLHFWLVLCVCLHVVQVMGYENSSIILFNVNWTCTRFCILKVNLHTITWYHICAFFFCIKSDLYIKFLNDLISVLLFGLNLSIMASIGESKLT